MVARRGERPGFPFSFGDPGLHSAFRSLSYSCPGIHTGRSFEIENEIFAIESFGNRLGFLNSLFFVFEVYYLYFKIGLLFLEIVYYFLRFIIFSLELFYYFLRSFNIFRGHVLFLEIDCYFFRFIIFIFVLVYNFL